MVRQKRLVCMSSSVFLSRCLPSLVPSYLLCAVFSVSVILLSWSCSMNLSVICSSGKGSQQNGTFTGQTIACWVQEALCAGIPYTRWKMKKRNSQERSESCLGKISVDSLIDSQFSFFTFHILTLAVSSGAFFEVL